MDIDVDDARGATGAIPGSLGILLKGNRISGVAAGTPSEQLLQVGDEIVSIDGVPVDAEDIQMLVSGDAGKTAKIVVSRAGRQVSFQIMRLKQERVQAAAQIFARLQHNADPNAAAIKELLADIFKSEERMRAAKKNLDDEFNTYKAHLGLKEASMTFCTHTHIHTHTYTYIHTHTHTHTQARRHSREKHACYRGCHRSVLQTFCPAMSIQNWLRSGGVLFRMFLQCSRSRARMLHRPSR